MTEVKAPSKIRGWLKAAITSIMGLCSGAVLMYVSPLVTTVIKPAKPLANFAQQVQGLTVTFQNRATGATDGWWDFGDGSPLEPFSATQEAVTHIYNRPGSYSVKLSLRNFLGDENERTGAVNLDDNGTITPAIEVFKVDPIKSDAPATFKVAAQIKNADLCVWSLGDDRPLEVSTDGSLNQERYVNIKEPGYYTLKLVAVSGKHTVERSESVFVNIGDNASASATLHVAYQAIQVHRLTKEVNLHTAFPADYKEPNFPFSVTHVESDYQILNAKFAKPVKDAGIKNPDLAISTDKSKVILTGELVKPAGIMAWQKNPPPLKWTATVVLTLERRYEPVIKVSDPIAVDLTVPGTTLLPLPKLTSRWEIKGTTFDLELRDGTALVFKDSKLPVSQSVQFKNHPYRLTATQGPGNIRLDLIDARATLRPIGN